MTAKELQKKIKHIEVMGFNELCVFKEKLHESLLEASEKFLLFVAVDKREANLDKSSAMAEYAEVEID